MVKAGGRMRTNGTIKNLLLQSSYQILAIIIPLITTPYLSRTLGADNLGTFSYSYSIAYYFVIVMQLGLNNYGNREIAKVRDNKQQLSKTFCEIYCVQLICSFWAILAYVIYMCVFATNKLYALLILPYVISGMFDINWLFFGLEEFKITVSRNTIIKILTTTCIFLFVKSSNDAAIYALIMTISILCSQVVIWPFVPKRICVQKVKYSDVIRHFKPNFILFIPVVAVSLYKTMDKIMLGNLSNLYEVGLYDSSEKIIQIPLALITALGTVMLPRMSNIYAHGNEQKAERVFMTSIEIAMFLSTSLSFGIMSVAKDFVPWFYGAGYEKCIDLFLILLPSCLFLAFANVIRTQFLVPKGKDIQFIISLTSGAVVNVIANSILIPHLQSIGAAIGTLLAEIIVCVIQVYMVRKDLPVKKAIFFSIPYLLAGLIMFFCIYGVEFNVQSVVLGLFLKSIFGAIVYLCSVLVLIKARNSLVKLGK